MERGYLQVEEESRTDELVITNGRVVMGMVRDSEIVIAPTRDVCQSVRYQD